MIVLVSGLIMVDIAMDQHDAGSERVNSQIYTLNHLVLNLGRR